MTKYFETSCPHCRRILRVRTEYIGRRVCCNHCNQDFIARTTGSPTPAPTAPRPALPEASVRGDPFSLGREATGPGVIAPGDVGPEALVGGHSADLPQFRESQAQLAQLQGQMQTLRGELDQARAQLQRDAALQGELAVARAERDQLRALIAALRNLLSEADINGKEARPRRFPGDSEPSIQNGSRGSSHPPELAPDRSGPFGEHEGNEALSHAGPAVAPQATPVWNDGIVPLEFESGVPSRPAEKEAGESPGPFAIPGYQILGTLREGAMGRVYQARQTSLDRIVAVKALYSTRAKTPEFRLRFLREAKLASQLAHPNLIHTIDAGEVNGHPYYIMEYVEGETIEDRLGRRRVFDETTALRIILSVAEALKYIHERGLIHRDIKPANVILTREGGVKLADLGLARPTTDAEWAASEAGRAIGTPDYISPEQARGQVDADIRADIYGLGATLYRMVTGRVPHDGATTAEVLHKHVDRETNLIPPQQINPAVSPRLSAVILRMLARDREERYRHPDDLILDLRGLLSGAADLPGPRPGTAP